MKNLITLLLSFCYLAAGAQQDCSRYDKFMAAGKAAINLEDALNQFLSAQTAAKECGVTTDAATEEIKKIFTQIGKQRDDATNSKLQAEAERVKADAARMDAVRAREETQHALANAQAEKIRADSARIVADRARDTTEIALRKANKLVSAFYFYDDRFALLFGSKQQKFYFIDKEGNKVDRLGNWDKALQFEDGFAKVATKFYDVYGSDTFTTFLLDTLGNSYPMAFDYKDIDSSITALDLRNMNLEEIPPHVFTKSHLQVLLLNRNKQQKLPAQLANLSNLIMLDVSNNELSNLPPQIGRLQKLNRLYANHNNLTGIPDEIGRLNALTELSLGANEIDKLPPQLGELTNLTYLSLKKNALKNLPEQISNLKLLKRLDLSVNEFEALPPEIGSLENLTTLVIGYNRLSTLPGNFDQLKNLRYLSYSGKNTIPRDEIDKLRSHLPKCSIY